MGQKLSKVTHVVASVENPFKPFEYQCPGCRTKRPVQFFHKHGRFVQQTPRVVCGECNTSFLVEPFKTVDFCCPACKKWQKARLPARPVPLNTYNVSVVSCNCGFKGEVNTGRLMDVICSRCWQRRRELCDVWTEDGDELEHFCEHCQDNTRCFAQAPTKKGEESKTEMEYTCECCEQVRRVNAEELLRSEGLACCTCCSWKGCPQVHPLGHFDMLKLQKRDAASRKNGQAATPKKGGESNALRGGRSSKVKPQPDLLDLTPVGIPNLSQTQARSGSSLGV